MATTTIERVETAVPTTGRVDTALVARAHQLREHAADLRNEANGFDEILATTYRRRAAELELEAWATEVRSGLPVTQIQPIAA